MRNLRNMRLGPGVWVHVPQRFPIEIRVDHVDTELFRAGTAPVGMLHPGAGGVNALHLSDLFTHARQQINLIPGHYLPIFDGGRLNANLGGARAPSNRLSEQYNEAVLNAVRDAAQTGSRVQALDAQIALRDTQARAEQVSSNPVKNSAAGPRL